MPRQARQHSEYMHIIVRGIGKQILFENDADRTRYLDFLRKYQKDTGISILAYCLMENHVHLLVHDENDNLSAFMKKTGGSYAQYYNRKYDRAGHLFQDRYKSEPIRDEAYLLSAFRYILNNPQKAGICAAEEYPWSSVKEYGRPDGITDTTMLCEMIGSVDLFLHFLSQPGDVECMDVDSRKKDDTWALTVLQKTLSVSSGTILQQYDRKERDNALALLKKKGLSIRQIERLTGINRGVIQKAN